jgi:hydroxymethylpyrimidine pyrophosphatase-like HAD family hydrolase
MLQADGAGLRQYRGKTAKMGGAALDELTRVGSPPVRMIAVDMDGTLVGADRRVSAENLAALREAEAAGIEVVVATGRRHCYAMRVLRALELGPQSALVSSNGTVVRRVGPGAAVVEQTLLPLETARWLCGHLGEFRDAMVMTFDRVQPDGEDARGALVVEEMAELNASIGRWMEANAPYIERVAPIEEALEDTAGEGLIQMMLCGRVERMRRAEARMLELAGVVAAGVVTAEMEAGAKVTLHRTEYPERDLSIVDILPAGCSKGAALLRLAQGMGIAGAEMLCVGDNWNDVSMLEIAGRAVLMENAPEDLKALARERGWRIGGHYDRSGVAEAIRAVLTESRDLVGAAAAAVVA